MVWYRPGLPLLSNLAGPVQRFKADAWRDKVSADLCSREGFWGGFHGSSQLLNSSHVRERDKALLRSVMVGGVWNGFLLGRVRGQPVPCRFCGAPDGDGHLFWECTFPPLVEIRENPEFHNLTRWIRLIGLDACFGMVGCLCFLVLMVLVRGLLMLLRVLAIRLVMLWDPIHLGWSLSGVFLKGLILFKLLLRCPMFPVCGLMAALFSIRSQVFPPLALGSLLTILSFAGGRVMLIRFVLMVLYRLVEAFVLSLTSTDCSEG